MLEQLLQQPLDASHIIARGEAYGESGAEQLVRDVIALANLPGRANRYIILGVEHDDVMPRVTGLEPGDLEQLKAQHLMLTRMIEPQLQLIPIFDQFKGKSVAAIEIGNCGNPPYIVRDNLSPRLRKGECWILGDAGVRPAVRQDYDRMYARKTPAESVSLVQVGLGDDPKCDVLDIAIPNRDALPSRLAARKIRQAVQAKRSTKKVLGTDDTSIARLVHARLHGPDIPFDPAGTQTLIQDFHSAHDEHALADRYYLYEQQAIRLNLTIANHSDHRLTALCLQLSLPCIDEFDVAECIYAPEGEAHSRHELEMLGYPAVSKSGKAALVSASLGDLAQSAEQSVFGADLRLAIDPALRGKKLAIRYTVQAEQLDQPVEGRLKLRFTV